MNIIDLNFLGISQAIASYLIETSEGPVLIETGPHSTFPHLQKGIEAAGYTIEDIKHVFITHIHLDHAGACWAFAEKGATVYLHPFGEKHMANPEKLMASAKRIYQEQMDILWGQMHPIPTDQLQTVAHEEVITIGDTDFTAWHTPGHAVHHIAWQVGDDLFAGDVAGVKIGDGMVVPPCPPPDINIEDWQQSIQLIRKINPTTVYLTHFNGIHNVDEHLTALEENLIDWANWIKPQYEARRSVGEVTPEFQDYVQQQLIDFGVEKAGLAQYEAANPSWMSVAGLMRYWKKKEG